MADLGHNTHLVVHVLQGQAINLHHQIYFVMHGLINLIWIKVNSSERRSPYTELWENCLDKIWPSVVIYHIPDFCYAAPLVNRVWTFFRDLVALTHCLVKTIED